MLGQRMNKKALHHLIATLISNSNKFERNGCARLDIQDCRQTACSKEGTANNNINAVSVTDVGRLLVHAIFSSSTGTVL